MSWTRRVVAVGVAVVFFLFSSQSVVKAQGGQSNPQAGSQPAQTPAPSESPAPPPITVTENVVVSASKTEQQIVDAPATMTVIGSRALEVAPSADYSQVL